MKTPGSCACDPTRLRGLLDWAPDEELNVRWFEGGDARVAARQAEILWYLHNGADLRGVLDQSPRLRWVTTITVGVEIFPLKLLKARGTILTNGAGISAIPISEHVLMLALATRHRLDIDLRNQSEHRWDSRAAGGGELAASRALVLGYGGIGRAVGERLRACGVNVVGVRRHPDGQGEIGWIAGVSCCRKPTC